MKHFYAEQFFNGETILPELVFSVDKGLVSNIQTLSEYQTDKVTPLVKLNGLVTAGFIDTQVNGGGGVLFNHSPDINTLKTMSLAHAQYGTTGMLPTLITDSIEKMEQASSSIKLAQAEGLDAVLGIHFEGPHLSQAKKGIHPSEHIRHLSDRELSLFTNQDLGKVLITIAPESVSTDIIKELVDHDICVSIGHSNANIDLTLKAIEAGASATTHLFNAMSGLKAREPGIINAALIDERLSSGIIADLHHVSAFNLKLAYKSIGKQRLMLVTDAMAHTGSDLDKLDWHGSTITKQENRLSLPDGSIAGSCLDMCSAVKNMHKCADVPLEDALSMASNTPAQYLGLDKLGQLRIGNLANFCVLNDNLQCDAVYVKGIKV